MKARRFSLLSHLLIASGFILTSLPQASAFIVPDTGIKECYDDQGNQIVCPEPGQDFHGQDAQYGKGTMSIVYNQHNGDGYASDTDSGLMWEIKENGDNATDLNNPNDADNTYSWADLSTFIDNLNAISYAGYSDWRLPNVKELETIIDLSVPEPGPVVIQDVFINCRQDFYWTNTPDAADSSRAWAIDFSSAGEVTASKTNAYHVRAVRGGQM